ncbi:PREDICTED: uncharacterized protein LOC105135344 isoform X2 [Populus euphratica]|uniref:Uncharacterized protein LOC105135344 isoform X2 n=1 Tax=Populus euphratica TaxID=75702 RepID=A0AAJ6Y1C0_POPEU|nr:PREDICTED: uncharacterized protein LOC105135344 isoform X2 [Populus euphratica]
MGCSLFACFTACKHGKCRHLVNVTPSKPHDDGATEASKVHEPTKQEGVPQVPIEPILESKENLEEQMRCNEKRKLTFNFNVETYEGLSTDEEVIINVVEYKEEERKSENKEEEPSNMNKSVSNVVASNVGCYHPNNRYQNRVDEEDYEDLDLEASDLNEAVQVLIQEEPSESLFSISIDSRKQVHGAELGEKEVSSPMPKGESPPKEEPKLEGSNQDALVMSRFDDPVLNPVENLIQWKEAKARATSPWQHEDKENVNVEQDFDKNISPETIFKLYKQKKLVDQEIAVDTSLSSWLATPPMSKGSPNSVGNTPSARSCSPRSHEDRPILGALTVEDLEQHSASNTPRRSRSLTPVETPLTGTVGSYWIHTGRVVESDSGSSSKGMLRTKKDEKLKWNSIPFEERLDRALEGAVAQV